MQGQKLGAPAKQQEESHVQLAKEERLLQWRE
jgi:hypothetical protein